MGFIEKIKQVATGKNLLERKQEAAAMAEIRKEANAAQLRERRVQAVKFAAEREKVAYERRTQQLRAPKKSFFAGAGNYGSSGVGHSPMMNILGGGQTAQRNVQPIRVAKRFKTIYVKKGKHFIKRRRAVKSSPRIQPQIQHQHFDVIGGFGGNRSKSNILGI